MNAAIAGLLCATMTCLIASSLQAQMVPSGRPMASRSLSDLVAKTRSTVVQIMTAAGSGTGFFINGDGIVVTAGHVVCCDSKGDNFDKISVALPVKPAANEEHKIFFIGNRSAIPAKVIDIDKDHDIAILKPDSNMLGGAMKTGFSSPTLQGEFAQRTAAILETKALEDGEEIYTSGFPLSFPVLITTSGAIASSVPFEFDPALFTELHSYWADIQVNHGNSGGPVFSRSSGRVIGIVHGVRLAEAESSGHVIYGEIEEGKPLQPIRYNSGIAYVVPAEYIAALLDKNKISYEKSEPKQPK
jgi:S1-C subfamily serine protease